MLLFEAVDAAHCAQAIPIACGLTILIGMVGYIICWSLKINY